MCFCWKGKGHSLLWITHWITDTKQNRIHQIVSKEKNEKEIAMPYHKGKKKKKKGKKK